MDQSVTYNIFNREEWGETLERSFDIQVSEKKLNHVASVNDSVDMQDVVDIYLPILQVLSIYIRHYQERQHELHHKFNQDIAYTPYIIGVSGSVSVGKSTFARLLRYLLAQHFSDKKIQLMTTDGFLYPNHILRENNLMNRKGFPESYDMEALLHSLENIKNGMAEVEVPQYSHKQYDVLPDERLTIDNPYILIVEGINVLQLPNNEKFFISDFFDFSFFIDAQTEDIEKWYTERYLMIREDAMQQPDHYFHEHTKWSKGRARKYAERVWKNINLPNLEEYILPTRSRADMILHKDDTHRFDRIFLRKF